MSKTYKLIGKRWLRKYTASKATPVYAAESEVSVLSKNLCNVAWQRVAPKDAGMTYHTDNIVYYEDPAEETGGVTGLDYNVMVRDTFDAALFCAYHKSETHKVLGNAACYKFVLPDMTTYPTLQSLKVNVTSDPYNSTGARIAIFTNSTGEIPTACSDCRMGCAPTDGHSCTRTTDTNDWITNDTYADAVAPRRSVSTTTSGKTTTNWYPVNGTCTFNLGTALQLQKYLYVFVLLENYNTCRGNWVEGCSFIENLVEVVTSGTVTGWTAGGTIDLSSDTVSSSEVGSSSVDIVKDGVVPDVVGAKSPFVTATMLESGTVPRLGDGRIASVLPQVSDELTSKNLNAGVATAVGLVSAGKAEAAALGTTNPIYKSFGAGFCVHHSSDLKFVDVNGNEANPKSLCVTAASLMVPFGLDAGVEMNYAKFDWSTWFLGAVTPTGAKLNFWMKAGSFEQEYPNLTDPSFYLADETSVFGWSLLVSANVSDGSATVDLSQALGKVISGVNTVLVTAYVPASAVDASDTDDFSQGVGTFWYNAVTPDANLKIDIDLYPAFDPTASYSKDAQVSYGTNMLTEWNRCSGTSGTKYVKTSKTQYRRLAFGAGGIKYSDDGIAWNSSSVTSDATSLKAAFEVGGVGVAVFGSNAYCTTIGTTSNDGSSWTVVKALGAAALCADRISKGMLVGTASGAYRVGSNGYSASDWEAVTMPSVPVRAVSVIPNSYAFSTDCQLFASDKCLYYSANSGGTLAIASLPTYLKAVNHVSASGASRVCTDNGFFTKTSDVWVCRGLIGGDVRYLNTDASPWVAVVGTKLWYSEDGGSTWTETSAEGSYLSVSYYGGVWVATGDGVMSWSDDGKTWNAVSGVSGTCRRAIHVDPFWYAGFSDGKFATSETGKIWTMSSGDASDYFPSGVNFMYETDQGSQARMGVVCAENGLFRTILDDSSIFFNRCKGAYHWYGQVWSSAYGYYSELSGAFYDACKQTTEDDGQHVLAAGSAGIFSIDLGEDGYMNTKWVQVKDSVSMGTVRQVMPGGTAPSTYMLARADDGSIYRYGTDIRAQSYTARRTFDTTAAKTWEYTVKPLNGKYVNLSYGRHAIGASNNLQVSTDYGDHSWGNWVYSLYNTSNASFPKDNEGYFIFYDDSGNKHRFKIVDSTTAGSLCSVANLSLQFASDDTIGASWFTRSDNGSTYTTDTGITYPAGVTWSLNNSAYSSTRMFLAWYVNFNDDHTQMSLSRYVASIGYTVSPSATDGTFTFYSPDGETLVASFDSSTEKLTVTEGVSWRNVNTLGNNVPAADFLFSDSTGDYAFCKNKVYKGSSNGAVWTLVDTLVDHCPFVHLKSSASLCLAVDQDGNTFKSTDNGHSWTPYQNTVATPRFDILNGKWFVHGSDKMMVSDDGSTWTDTSVVLPGVRCIEYANDVYVCANSTGVYRSVDGISWTKISDRSDVNSLSFEGDRWVASCDDGVLWSGDDPIFETCNVPAAPVSGFTKTYAYNGSSKVIGCSSDMSGLWYSSDGGATWAQSNVRAGFFYDVVSGNGSMFVAVGNGGVYYSSGGTSWTRVSDIEGDYMRVAYGNYRYVVVGTTGLYYSTNGSTWTTPFAAFTAMAYGAAIESGYSRTGIRWAAVNTAGLYYCNDGSSWHKVDGTSGVFTNVTRTRNVKSGPEMVTGAYLVAYSSSQTWYASDTDLSSWTKFDMPASAKFTRVEKTVSGWLAARSSYLYYSTDGSTWSMLSGHGVGTISDVFANNTNGTEEFIVAGSSGVAYSVDGGTTWTKLSAISGAVKELVPGLVSATAVYRSVLAFMTSGAVYAINLYNGSDYVPVATALSVPDVGSTFVAAVCMGFSNGSAGQFYLQTSDFTVYSVSATTMFFRETPSYTAHTGLTEKMVCASVGGNGRILVATTAGLYSSSSYYYNNFTWTKVADSSGSSGFSAIAVESIYSDLYFAVEPSGKMYRSTDTNTQTWNLVGSGLASSLFAVAYTGSLWVASGAKTLVSTNGTTWTEVSSGITSTTAVGGSSANLLVSSASNYAYSFDSGSTWTASTAIKNANRFYYLNSLWYACTATGLFTSPDMITWTACISGAVVPDMILNGSQWVAIGNVGSALAVWTSSDGLAWTKATVTAGVPMFGSSMYSVAATSAGYVISGQGGTYGTTDLTTWALRYQSGLPVVNGLDECGSYLVACTSQGVFYSLNKGTTWYPTNLHSGVFYGAAYRKYTITNTTDQVAVAGEIGIFVAFKTRTNSSLTFGAVSSDTGFMTNGYTDIIRGDGHRWFAVSEAGLFYCADAQVSGWARLVNLSFRTLVRDGQTIIAAGEGGIYCTSNGGANWVESNPISGGTLATQAGFSKVSKVGSVWVAASGEDGIYAELAEDTRIYYSKDGITWTLGAMDFGDYATGLAYMAYGTNTVTDGSRLYTGLRFYYIGSVGCGAYTNGVYYSDDCGRTWNLCTKTRGLDVRGLAYDSSTDLVYAFVGKPINTDYGVWVSSDHGATWRRLGTSGDFVYTAPFTAGDFAKGYLWSYGSANDDINLVRVKPGTGSVKTTKVYKAKGDVSPSQFDFNDWEEVESPVRNRLFGANSLCIPDITLYS